ncbi:MAG: T9SS type A sorting domain-containing protein [Paludibacteraceae bacterium]|nr:T9SS type A sorting domain-containing protein [Paludibacteraceae bacterium]MBR2936475.1 T9SS type A sorting domain-containing protein [Paludibacteraceae bacterium]
MKNTLILICAMLCSLQCIATNLVLLQTDGTQQLQDIAKIGKWVFTEENLQLIDKDGNVLAIEAIAEVKKITFSISNSETTTENVAINSIVVYPNPTQDILHIAGITPQTLRVFDLQGRLLIIENSTQVNVSNLNTGTYLLQVGTQVIRFIKQ